MAVPVGLGTLSVNIAEERETVEDNVRTLPNPERALSCELVQDELRPLRLTNI